MRTLEFLITGQTISIAPGCDTNGLVAGSVGYLKAVFHMDSAWQGCKIAASFWNGSKEYAVLVRNGTCEIAAEALTGHIFGVSLTGVKDNYRIQTNKLQLYQEVL